VVSRKAGTLEARRWDLDYVICTDKWILQKPDAGELQRIPLVDKLGRDGTLVLWENLDRLDAVGPAPEQAYAALNELFASARAHLALTFHRFIAPDPSDGVEPPDPSDGVEPIAMTINGALVEALDPFARSMQPQSDAHEVEVIGHHGSDIVVQAFTLPHHKRLTQKQLEALELGDSLLQTQGLYVYRARRLIAGGTWPTNRWRHVAGDGTKGRTDEAPARSRRRTHRT